MLIHVIKCLIEILIFLLLMVIFKFILNKLKNSSPKLLNPIEYFPEEEIHTLRQTYYLIMMGLFFINVLYSFICSDTDMIYLAIFDIILSLYVAVELDKSSLKNKIILLLLIPYGSLTFILFNTSLIGLLDFIHVPIFIYFIKVYYDKFKEYTESNSLGIAILLLFTIIFFSFFTTQLFENVNPLDSLDMVSNAFTSNRYTVLGNSIGGKINSIILVWGGYLLSSVGTATLTAAILTKHFNKKFDKIEKLIEKNKKE